MAEEILPNQMLLTFSEIRLALMGLTKRHPDEIAATSDIAERLERLQQLCLSAASSAANTTADDGDDSSRGGGGQGYGRAKRYYRVNSVRGLCLAEDWAEAKQPYFVPRSVYKKCAKVVGGCNKPVTFEAVVRKVRKVLPDTPEYMLRVCLRFWRQADPPLVELIHRQYHVLVTDSFKPAAMGLWKRLAERQG